MSSWRQWEQEWRRQWQEWRQRFATNTDQQGRGSSNSAQLLNGSSNPAQLFHGSSSTAQTYIGSSNPAQLFHGSSDTAQLFHGSLDPVQLFHGSSDAAQLFHGSSDAAQLFHGSSDIAQLRRYMRPSSTTSTSYSYDGNEPFSPVGSYPLSRSYYSEQASRSPLWSIYDRGSPVWRQENASRGGGGITLCHSLPAAPPYSSTGGSRDNTEREDILTESSNVQADSESAPLTPSKANTIEGHSANLLVENEKDKGNAIEDSDPPLKYSISSPSLACRDDVGSNQSSMTESSSNDEPNVIATRFISELSKHIVDLFRTACESQFRKSTEPQGAANGSSSRSKQMHSLRRSQRSSGKRRRGDDQDDKEDEDEKQSGDDGDKRPVQSRKRRKTTKPMRLFACPFAKFDPERYSGNNRNEARYRKCSSLTLRDLSRVKQHLKRVHKQPDFYCARCYMEFNESSERNLHLRQEPPCQLGFNPFEERITDAQWASVQSFRLQNTPESWFDVFRALFPNAKEPKSPYQLREPILVHEFARFFRWIGPQLMYRYVQARCEKDDASTYLDLSLGALILETFEESLQNFDWQHDPLVGLLEQHPKDTKRRDRSGCSHKSPAALDDLGDSVPDSSFQVTTFQTTEMEPMFAELFSEFDNDTTYEHITLDDLLKGSSDTVSSGYGPY